MIKMLQILLNGWPAALRRSSRPNWIDASRPWAIDGISICVIPSESLSFSVILEKTTQRCMIPPQISVYSTRLNN